MLGCSGEVREMEARECSCRSEFQVAEESEALVQQVVTQLRPHFRRQAAHQHAADYLRGLIADVERKNGWQLAEHADYGHPRGMQRVLDRYAWEHRAVRNDLRRYVVTEWGDPHGVLVVDETGFVKQGKHSVGLARRTAAPWARSPTARWGCFWATPLPRVTLESMVPSLCPKSGSRTRNAVRKRGYRQGQSIAPSPS